MNRRAFIAALAAVPLAGVAGLTMMEMARRNVARLAAYVESHDMLPWLNAGPEVHSVITEESLNCSIRDLRFMDDWVSEMKVVKAESARTWTELLEAYKDDHE